MIFLRNAISRKLKTIFLIKLICKFTQKNLKVKEKVSINGDQEKKWMFYRKKC